MSKRRPNILIIGAEQIPTKIAHAILPSMMDTHQAHPREAINMAGRKLRSHDAIVICHFPRVRADSRTAEGTDVLEDLYRLIDTLNKMIGGGHGRYMIYTFGVPVYSRDLPLEGTKAILYQLVPDHIRNVLNGLLNPVTP